MYRSGFVRLSASRPVGDSGGTGGWRDGEGQICFQNPSVLVAAQLFSRLPSARWPKENPQKTHKTNKNFPRSGFFQDSRGSPLMRFMESGVFLLLAPSKKLKHCPGFRRAKRGSSSQLHSMLPLWVWVFLPPPPPKHRSALWATPTPIPTLSSGGLSEGYFHSTGPPLGLLSFSPSLIHLFSAKSGGNGKTLWIFFFFV